MTRAWRGQVELDREELLETEAAIFRTHCIPHRASPDLRAPPES